MHYLLFKKWRCHSPMHASIMHAVNRQVIEDQNERKARKVAVEICGSSGFQLFWLLV